VIDIEVRIKPVTPLSECSQKIKMLVKATISLNFFVADRRNKRTFSHYMSQAVVALLTCSLLCKTE
jgi:hypothetical protein